MAIIRLDDMWMHYRIEGPSGAPWILLLMGFSGNLNWWPEQLLASLRQNYRLLLLDNRGTGHSSRGRKYYSIHRLAEDAAALVEALKIPQVTVLGVSMGGMIAQEFALSHAKRVSRLILACSFGGILPHKILSKDHFALLQRYVQCPVTRRSNMFSNLIFTRHYRLQMDRAEWLKISRAMSENPPSKAVIREQLAAIMRWRSWKRLHQIKIPCLIMTGDRDLLVNPEYSKKLSQSIAGSQLLVFPQQGHGFLYEMGERVLPPIHDFLTKTAATRPNHPSHSLTAGLRPEPART